MRQLTEIMQFLIFIHRKDAFIRGNIPSGAEERLQIQNLNTAVPSVTRHIGFCTNLEYNCAFPRSIQMHSQIKYHLARVGHHGSFFAPKTLESEWSVLGQ